MNSDDKSSCPTPQQLRRLHDMPRMGQLLNHELDHENSNKSGFIVGDRLMCARMFPENCTWRRLNCTVLSCKWLQPQHCWVYCINWHAFTQEHNENMLGSDQRILEFKHHGEDKDFKKVTGWAKMSGVPVRRAKKRSNPDSSTLADTDGYHNDTPTGLPSPSTESPSTEPDDLFLMFTPPRPGPGRQSPSPAKVTKLSSNVIDEGVSSDYHSAVSCLGTPIKLETLGGGDVNEAEKEVSCRVLPV